MKWLPWRFLLSRLARSRGFVDPIALLSRLHRFAQPSEVTEPIELLRAGVLLHARGLINTRTIQHNLDWVWPFWIERQFNPGDRAFVPRAFSITHVNLTHRNWTAVGQPDCDCLPIVDPRGLLTPLFDGWSLDTWIIPEQGRPLLPSRARDTRQVLTIDGSMAVETRVQDDGLRLRNTVDVIVNNARPMVRLQVLGDADAPASLVVALRPVNPEGVSFISSAEFHDSDRRLTVNGTNCVEFSVSPDSILMSDYHRGDVLQALPLRGQEGVFVRHVACNVGLATVAAVFSIRPRSQARVLVQVPLDNDAAVNQSSHRVTDPKTRWDAGNWKRALERTSRIEVPDNRFKFLFDAAVRSLILHSPGKLYSGPYTYKRFWFRDAAFILNALLTAGSFDRVRRVIDSFPSRQRRTGYFCSQEGEWDSNGQAIWIIDQYQRLSGESLSGHLINAVSRGAHWLRRKRLSDRLAEPHAGLLPAGFSAEHLGPNDFYYWDDFWAAAGLSAAARILEGEGKQIPALAARQEADLVMRAIDRSIEHTRPARERQGVPASPYRRMDSGAIGSLAAGYPLQLWSPHDPRLTETADFLLANCMVNGGFFQDMIHSGTNVYLTLHLAQVLLRAGDRRYWRLVRKVAELASPTGQWPEAIHPFTGGGCMGDGQHMWAAAEWILMIRNCFVREEDNHLVLGSGLPVEWLTNGAKLSLGPTPTSYGPVRVQARRIGRKMRISWEVHWRSTPAPVEVRLPGFAPRTVGAGEQSVDLPITSGRAGTGYCEP